MLIARESVEMIVPAIQRKGDSRAARIPIEDVVVSLVSEEVIVVNAEPSADGEAIHERWIGPHAERAVGMLAKLKHDLERNAC